MSATRRAQKSIRAGSPPPEPVLGTRPDDEIAVMLDTTVDSILSQVSRLNIPACAPTTTVEGRRPELGRQGRS
jgi:hypothetical protein